LINVITLTQFCEKHMEKKAVNKLTERKEISDYMNLISNKICFRGNWIGQFLKYQLLILLLLGLFWITGCDLPFINDGGDNGINQENDYLYLLDSGTCRLIMLNTDLAVINSWDLSAISVDSLDASLQGITYDGDYLWISIAGNDDQIFKVGIDSTSVNVVGKLTAPPDEKGVVRDIAYDGVRLWALNSGSVTYSMPATLYELDIDGDSVLNEYTLPCPEPRGLTYVPENTDVYGRSIPEGLYFTDKDVDKVYRLRLDKRMIEEVFEVPVPARGESFTFPIGLYYSGKTFWLVNSSDTADLLYELEQDGEVINMFELPYESPGPIVWTDRNFLALQAPEIYSITPNTVIPGETKELGVFGKGFIDRTGLNCSFDTDDITVDSLHFISAAELTVYISVTSTAQIGQYDVIITNFDGQSGTLIDGITISDYDPSNGYFWFTDTESDSLYKVKVSDFSIVQRWNLLEIAPGGSAQGLDFDGTNYWLASAGSDDKIYRIDVSGEELSTELSFSAPPNQQGTVREICSDGTYLWALNDEFIYALNPSDGTVIDTINTPRTGARGIVFVGDDLYCNDYVTDSIYVYLADEDKWNACFETPVPPNGTIDNRYPTGMAYDGVNLWFSNSTYEYDYIFQVDFNGNVVRTYEVPNRGDAKPTGLMFTKE